MCNFSFTNLVIFFTGASLHCRQDRDIRETFLRNYFAVIIVVTNGSNLTADMFAVVYLARPTAFKFKNSEIILYLTKVIIRIYNSYHFFLLFLIFLFEVFVLILLTLFNFIVSSLRTLIIKNLKKIIFTNFRNFFVRKT